MVSRDLENIQPIILIKNHKGVMSYRPIVILCFGVAHRSEYKVGLVHCKQDFYLFAVGEIGVISSRTDN